MMQGDPGDLFYIIKEGEAVVYQATPQGTRKVNHLFKADFFGERALLCDEPRYCALTPLCYSGPPHIFCSLCLHARARLGLLCRHVAGCKV